MAASESGCAAPSPLSHAQAEVRPARRRESSEKLTLEEILQQELSDDEEFDRLILDSSRPPGGATRPAGYGRVEETWAASRATAVSGYGLGNGVARAHALAVDEREDRDEQEVPLPRQTTYRAHDAASAHPAGRATPACAASDSPCQTGSDLSFSASRVRAEERGESGSGGEACAKSRFAGTTRTVEEILRDVEEEDEEWLSTLLPQVALPTTTGGSTCGLYTPPNGQGRQQSSEGARRDSGDDGGAGWRSPHRPASASASRVTSSQRPSAGSHRGATARDDSWRTPGAASRLCPSTRSPRRGARRSSLSSVSSSSCSCDASPSRRGAAGEEGVSGTETPLSSSAVSSSGSSARSSRATSVLSDSADAPSSCEESQGQLRSRPRRTGGLLAPMTSPPLPSSLASSLQLLRDSPLRWTCRSSAALWGGAAARKAARVLAEEDEAAEVGRPDARGHLDPQRGLAALKQKARGSEIARRSPEGRARGRSRQRDAIPAPLEEAALNSLGLAPFNEEPPTTRKGAECQRRQEKPATWRHGDESHQGGPAEDFETPEKTLEIVRAPTDKATGVFDTIAQGFSSLQSLVASVGFPTCFHSVQNLLSIGTSRGFALLVDVHALPALPETPDARRSFFASFFASPQAFPLFLPPLESADAHAAPGAIGAPGAADAGTSAFLSVELGEVAATCAPEEAKVGAVASIALAENLRFLLVGYKSGTVALYEIHSSKVQRLPLPPGCTYTPPDAWGEAAASETKAERVPLLRGYQATLVALSKDSAGSSLAPAAENDGGGRPPGDGMPRRDPFSSAQSSGEPQAKKSGREATDSKSSSSVCCLRFLTEATLRGATGGRSAAAVSQAPVATPGGGASFYGSDLWPVPSLGRASVLPSGALAVALAADERGDLFVISFQKTFLSVACDRRCVTTGIRSLGAIIDIRVLPAPPPRVCARPSAAEFAVRGLLGARGQAFEDGVVGGRARGEAGARAALERGIRSLPLLGRAIPGSAVHGDRRAGIFGGTASPPVDSDGFPEDPHPADEAQIFAVACSNAVLILRLLPLPALVYRIDLVAGSLSALGQQARSEEPAGGRASERRGSTDLSTPRSAHATHGGRRRQLSQTPSFASSPSAAASSPVAPSSPSAGATLRGGDGEPRTAAACSQEASHKQRPQTCLPDLPCVTWLRAAFRHQRLFDNPVLAAGLSCEIQLFEVKAAPRGASAPPGSGGLVVEPGACVFSVSHPIQSLMAVQDSVLCVLDAGNILSVYQLMSAAVDPLASALASPRPPTSSVELRLLQRVDVSLANPVYYRFTDISLITQLVRQQREKRRETRRSSGASPGSPFASPPTTSPLSRVASSGQSAWGGVAYGLLGVARRDSAARRLLAGAKAQTPEARRQPGSKGASREAGGDTIGAGSAAEEADDVLPVFAASYANSLCLGYGGVAPAKPRLAEMLLDAQDEGDWGGRAGDEAEGGDLRRRPREGLRCPGDQGTTEIWVVGLEGLVVVRLRSWLEVLEELLAAGRGLEALAVLKCLYDGRLPPLLCFSPHRVLRQQTAALPSLAAAVSRGFCLATLRHRRWFSSFLPSLLPAAQATAPPDRLWRELVALLARCVFELVASLRLYPLLNGVVFRAFTKLIDQLESEGQLASSPSPSSGAGDEEACAALAPAEPPAGDSVRHIFFSLLIRYLVLGELPSAALDPDVVTALVLHLEGQLEGGLLGDKTADAAAPADCAKRERGSDDEAAPTSRATPGVLLRHLTRFIGDDAVEETPLLAALIELESAMKATRPGPSDRGEGLEQVGVVRGETAHAERDRSAAGINEAAAKEEEADDAQFSLLRPLYIHLAMAPGREGRATESEGANLDMTRVVREKLLKYRLLRHLLQFVLMRLFGIEMHDSPAHALAPSPALEAGRVVTPEAETPDSVGCANAAGAADLLQILQLVSVHRVWLGVCLAYSRGFADFRTPVELLIGDAYRIQHAVFKNFIHLLQQSLSWRGGPLGESDALRGGAASEAAAGERGAGGRGETPLSSLGSLPLFVPPRDVETLRATREVFFFLFSLFLGLPYPLHGGRRPRSRRARPGLAGAEGELRDEAHDAADTQRAPAARETCDEFLWRQSTGGEVDLPTAREHLRRKPPSCFSASPLATVLDYVFRRATAPPPKALAGRLDFLFSPSLSAAEGGAPEVVTRAPEPPGWGSPQVFKRLFMMSPRMTFSLFSALLLASASSALTNPAAQKALQAPDLSPEIASAADDEARSSSTPGDEAQPGNAAAADEPLSKTEKRDFPRALLGLLLPAVADCIVDAASLHQTYLNALGALGARQGEPGGKGDRGGDDGQRGSGADCAADMLLSAVAALEAMAREQRRTLQEMHAVLWRLFVVGVLCVRDQVLASASLRCEVVQFFLCDAPPSINLLLPLLSRPLPNALKPQQLRAMLLTSSIQAPAAIEFESCTRRAASAAAATSAPRSPSFAWDQGLREAMLLAWLEKEADTAWSGARLRGEGAEARGRSAARALSLYGSHKLLLKRFGFLRAAALLCEAERDYDASLALWIRRARSGTCAADSGSEAGKEDAQAQRRRAPRRHRGEGNGGDDAREWVDEEDSRDVFRFIRELVLEAEKPSGEEAERPRGCAQMATPWRRELVDSLSFLRAVSRHLADLVELDCDSSARLICEIFRLQQQRALASSRSRTRASEPRAADAAAAAAAAPGPRGGEGGSRSEEEALARGAGSAPRSDAPANSVVLFESPGAIIDLLDGHPKLQLQLLEALMAGGGRHGPSSAKGRTAEASSFFSSPAEQTAFFHSQFVRYIRLLCQHDPRQVCAVLQQQERFPLAACLRVCEEFQVLDACAYLLERTGDFQGIIRLFQHAFSQDLDRLRSLFLVPSFDILPILRVLLPRYPPSHPIHSLAAGAATDDETRRPEACFPFASHAKSRGGDRPAAGGRPGGRLTGRRESASSASGLRAPPLVGDGDGRGAALAGLPGARAPRASWAASRERGPLTGAEDASGVGGRPPEELSDLLFPFCPQRRRDGEARREEPSRDRTDDGGGLPRGEREGAERPGSCAFADSRSNGSCLASGLAFDEEAPEGDTRWAGIAEVASLFQLVQIASWVGRRNAHLLHKQQLEDLWFCLLALVVRAQQAFPQLPQASAASPATAEASRAGSSPGRDAAARGGSKRERKTLRGLVYELVLSELLSCILHAGVMAISSLPETVKRITKTHRHAQLAVFKRPLASMLSGLSYQQSLLDAYSALANADMSALFSQVEATRRRAIAIKVFSAGNATASLSPQAALTCADCRGHLLLPPPASALDAFLARHRAGSSHAAAAASARPTAAAASGRADGRRSGAQAYYAATARGEEARGKGAPTARSSQSAIAAFPCGHVFHLACLREKEGEQAPACGACVAVRLSGLGKASRESGRWRKRALGDA
ncbi:hypothetical protein BESB_020510 [Besnoitia besnoiti]|uniref:Uncharacterized protein n=1 Tax=Besnoitia besnoiti TaxID=94643 RepID=A0A2A9M9Q1_BESBE|nr:hypothetical protein BESB_020510 [Besnoitia besnoiti]PFH32110.1 hypothetical protein BESB_020510 [Besnoitia besnoiti]